MNIKSLKILLISLVISSCQSTAGVDQQVTERPQRGSVEDTSSSTSQRTDCSTEGLSAISTQTEVVTLANAMQSFRSLLSPELLTEATFCLGTDAFYSWTNTPANGDRGGIKFGEMSTEQVAQFFKLLDAFLSTEGLEKVSRITNEVESALNEIQPNTWSTDFYHVALFGNPAEQGTWGFQLDGHHLAVNFLVDGDKVSILPAFLGAEPATVNGIEVLQQERSNAFALLNSLDETQQSSAIKTGDRSLQVGPGRSIDTNRDFDYSVFEGQGLKASDMTDAQKENLRTLIKTYVYNMETPFADQWMQDVEASFDETYFVWIGGKEATDTVYYRVFNPAVWIEYNNENGVGGGSALDHVHTITRSPAGNDYGLLSLASGPATLQAHYAATHHHLTETAPSDYQIALSNQTHHEHGHTH